ncbi:helix-turn-helix transcriptional regulator [Kiloniella laminariae]|uniref:helix-turn-helix transcriptional regulator n=1 Tax=Kiloniella laminariae TaxID=454162 RepID=UPI0003664E92|nr:helix-turn-helix transcriptional regulator [Kiloniella laminariae]
MKIDAKNTLDEQAKSRATLGESYRRQWDSWFLQLGARIQSANQAAGSNQKPQLTPRIETKEQVDLEILKLIQQGGYERLLQLCIRNAADIHFDPVSFLLSNALTPHQLVRRWSLCLKVQTLARQTHFSSTTQNQHAADWPENFIEITAPEEVTIRPFLSPLARSSSFGPIVLGGVACALFDLQDATLWYQPPLGTTRQLDMTWASSTLKNFKAHLSNYTPECALIISGQPKLRLNCKSSTQVTDLSHMFPDRRLLQHLLQLSTPRDGGHLTLRSAAKQLGFSPRSLSRKLTALNSSYSEISRYIRLRKSCQTLAESPLSLDELAWQQGYSDRHHLSREFRHLGGFTPANYRDILHSRCS